MAAILLVSNDVIHSWLIHQQIALACGSVTNILPLVLRWNRFAILQDEYPDNLVVLRTNDSIRSDCMVL